jgi:hypothetical protein
MGKRIADANKAVYAVIFLVQIAGLSLLAVYYFFDLSNQFVFWFSVAVSTAAVGLLLVGANNERMGLVALIAFAAVYHFAPLLRGSGAGIGGRLIFSRDEAYQQQVGSLVLQNGTWSSDMGTGPASSYSLYPIMPVLSAIMSNVVGPRAGFVLFSNVMFPILTAVLPIVFYVNSIESLVGDRNWALLAGYIFSLNEQFLFFDSSYAYESLAIVFFTGVIFLISRKLRGSEAALPNILAIALTFTHFWTDFNLVLFLSLFYVAPLVLTRLFRRHAYQDSFALRPNLSTIVIVGTLFVAYTALIAQVYLVRYGAEIAFIFLNLLGTPSRLQPQTTFRTNIEVALIILGQAVLVAYGAVGFLTRKKGPSAFLKVIFFLGGAYLVTILFGLPASVARPILHRGFFFAFIVIAPLVAWTIHKSYGRRKQLMALFLVVTVVSAILIQDPWFRYPDFVAPGSQVYAGTWASGNIMSDQAFISMRAISDTFGAYGRMRDIDLKEPFYSNESLIVSAIVEGRACSLLAPYKGHYVAVSSTTNDWLVRYYIERYYPLPGEQYVALTLHRLTYDPGFDRVFNVGFVSLYYAGC